jgi:transcriptional regulator with XRE-family HTH domain
MPNTTNWREIRKRRPPNETAVALEKLQLRLAMLREQVGASQVDVAEVLGTSQSNVSQLERSNDQMLSSIAKYVRALGGELKMTAVVGDTTYTLLDDVGELAPRRKRSRRTTSAPRKAPTARSARKVPTPPKASSRSRKQNEETSEA